MPLPDIKIWLLYSKNERTYPKLFEVVRQNQNKKWPAIKKLTYGAILALISRNTVTTEIIYVISTGSSVFTRVWRTFVDIWCF